MTFVARTGLLRPLSLFVLLFAGFAIAAEPLREWEDVRVSRVNTELPHATSVPYPDRATALSARPMQSPLVRSLNGAWRFRFSPTPEARPADFYKANFRVDDWPTIPVPGNWQTQGYGIPIYTNFTYPFRRDPPRVMAEPPKGWTAFTNRNEVGSYRRDFDLPVEWDGREVFVRFDGVNSAMYLWVNGQKVGYHEESRNPAEFRLTPYLKPGRNSMAVEVYRWSDGSYMEDQDMFRLSGIFRDVFLYAEPKTYVRDFFARPTLDATYTDGKLGITAKVKNTTEVAVKQTLAAELVDAAGHTVLTASKAFESPAAAEVAVNFDEAVKRPAQWSAETPNLYTLLLTLTDSDGKVLTVDRVRVGFRAIEIKDSVLLLNGRPIKLRGVDRHEHDPIRGHAITEELMLKDLRILKQNNINTVRTSHYPDQPRWLELCDEWGIYLVDEADLETHGMGYGRESLSNQPEWKQTHVDRNVAMVQRDKNHPSVIMWSYGNEAGPGPNFAAVRDAIKAIDTSRPTHYEGNSDYADVVSHMYPHPDAVAREGRRADGKPYFMCEFAHARGNGMGSLRDYWDIVEANPRCMGGCIWDFVDQTIDRPAKGRRTPDGRDVISLYGGDFGDEPNSGIEACNGLVLADRTPTAKLAEVKAVYQPVKFTAGNAADGRVTVANLNAFQSLAGTTLVWSLTRDGDVEQSGTLPCPPVPAGQSAEVRLPLKPFEQRPGAAYSVNVSLQLDYATFWADAGHTVAIGQFLIASQPATVANADKMPKLELTQTQDKVRVHNDTFSAEFGRDSGTLIGFKAATGPQLIGNGPALQVYRAPGDSDWWVARDWNAAGLADLKPQCTEFKVDVLSPGVVRVQASHRWTGKSDLTFTDDTQYVLFGDGTIDVSQQMTCSRDDFPLPRAGVRLTLPGGFERVRWFGRGPQENYPDRCSGALFGRYTSTVAAMYEPYVRPQTMGNRGGTSWCTLTNNDGVGLLISMPDPLAFTALHFAEQDLAGHRHPNELTPRGETVVSLDSGTMGLGSNSCGPRPLPKYVLRSKGTLTRFRLHAIDAAADVATLARTDMPVVAPVAVTRTRDSTVTLSCPTPGVRMTYAIDNGKAVDYAGPFKLLAGGTVTATAEATGRVTPGLTRVSFERLLDRTAWRVTANSEQSGEGDAAHAIDNDPSTYWHSRYTGNGPKPPFALTIDFGRVETIWAVTVLPRQDDENGRARECTIECSDDGQTWRDVTKAEFDRQDGLKRIDLASPVATRFVRYTVVSTQNGRPFATVAELDVVAE